MELFDFIRRGEMESFKSQFLKLDQKNSNFQDGEGNSFLHCACRQQSIDSVSVLLSHPFLCDVNLQNRYGQTPLMIAAETRDLKILDLLLSNGASLTFLDMLGRNVMHICAMTNNLAGACLCSRKASVQYRLQTPDFLGHLPIMYTTFPHRFSKAIKKGAAELKSTIESQPFETFVNSVTLMRNQRLDLKEDLFHIENELSVVAKSSRPQGVQKSARVNDLRRDLPFQKPSGQEKRKKSKKSQKAESKTKRTSSNLHDPENDSKKLSGSKGSRLSGSKGSRVVLQKDLMYITKKRSATTIEHQYNLMYDQLVDSAKHKDFEGKKKKKVRKNLSGSKGLSESKLLSESKGFSESEGHKTEEEREGPGTMRQLKTKKGGSAIVSSGPSKSNNIKRSKQRTSMLTVVGGGSHAWTGLGDGEKQSESEEESFFDPQKREKKSHDCDLEEEVPNQDKEEKLEDSSSKEPLGVEEASSPQQVKKEQLQISLQLPQGKSLQDQEQICDRCQISVPDVLAKICSQCGMRCCHRCSAGNVPSFPCENGMLHVFESSNSTRSERRRSVWLEEWTAQTDNKVNLAFDLSQYDCFSHLPPGANSSQTWNEMIESVEDPDALSRTHFSSSHFGGSSVFQASPAPAPARPPRTPVIKPMATPSSSYRKSQSMARSPKKLLIKGEKSHQRSKSNIYSGSRAHFNDSPETKTVPPLKKNDTSFSKWTPSTTPRTPRSSPDSSPFTSPSPFVISRVRSPSKCLSNPPPKRPPRSLTPNSFLRTTPSNPFSDTSDDSTSERTLSSETSTPEIELSPSLSPASAQLNPRSPVPPPVPFLPPPSVAPPKVESLSPPPSPSPSPHLTPQSERKGRRCSQKGIESLTGPVQITDEVVSHPIVAPLMYPEGTLAHLTKFYHLFQEFRAVKKKQEGTTIPDPQFIDWDWFLGAYGTMERSLFRQKTEDPMSFSLASYFISSSHNSYLVGPQLSGKSSVDIYRKILIDGCRCVELDCWDGDDGFPIVTHGPHKITLCTTVSFYDVVRIIANFSFFSSPYPVILSIENHCGPKQQALMAAYMVALFGGHLYLAPDTSSPTNSLPSPEDLKYKILVKANKEKVSSELGRIITLNSVSYQLDDRDPFHITSFDEMAIETKGVSEMIDNNSVRLSRIYPKGGRIDSSNYSAFHSWCKGCQLVALNWQTKDLEFSIYDGLFASNFATGYVLKPPHLRYYPPPPSRTLVFKFMLGLVLSSRYLNTLPTTIFIHVLNFTSGEIEKIESVQSKSVSHYEYAPPHIIFSESRVISNVSDDDLLLFRLKVGKGSEKRLYYASGQIRSVASGFFVLPLKSEKGLHVDLKIRLFGEVFFY